MKHVFLFVFLKGLMSSCMTDSYPSRNFVPNLEINFTVDMNLPQFQQLLIPGGHVYVSNLGHKGIVIYSLNAEDYYAYDLSCPHQACGTAMDRSNFPEFFNTCADDGIFYSIVIPGYSTTYRKDEEGNRIDIPSNMSYEMQAYAVTKIGNGAQLSITNFKY
ncbi:MAG: hypothetical protein ACPHXR_02190 [Flavicella sp.]